MRQTEINDATAQRLVKRPVLTAKRICLRVSTSGKDGRKGIYKFINHGVTLLESGPGTVEKKTEGAGNEDISGGGEGIHTDGKVLQSGKLGKVADVNQADDKGQLTSGKMMTVRTLEFRKLGRDEDETLSL